MRILHWSFLSFICLTGLAQRAPVSVVDIFGRIVDGHGITLVDWDGYIANPALKLSLVPNPQIALPATVVLSTVEPRLHFNAPSQVGTSGSEITLNFQKPSERPSFYLSIWPDRDGLSEKHKLKLLLTDATGAKTEWTIDVTVVDEDDTGPPRFPVHLDYTLDRSGFFRDPGARAAVDLAARDWVHFFDDMGLDPVSPNSEATPIWDPDQLASSAGWYRQTNDHGYQGFLLYVTGNTLTRSGGGVANENFQTFQSKPTELRRSGNVALGPVAQGPGYLFTLLDQEWWKFIYQAQMPVELLSLAQHEIGHSLIFNAPYPQMKKWLDKGCIDVAKVIAYQGECIPVDSSAHFRGVIDRLSRKGVYGSGTGEMPQHRWIATKAELLVAEAIGYRLRKTSAFIPAVLLTRRLQRGTRGLPYFAKFRAKGGVPFYDWRVSGGGLPPGLKLDPFSGELSGAPTLPGVFTFTVKVQDYDLENRIGDSRSYRLRIR